MSEFQPLHGASVEAPDFFSQRARPASEFPPDEPPMLGAPAHQGVSIGMHEISWASEEEKQLSSVAASYTDPPEIPKDEMLSPHQQPQALSATDQSIQKMPEEELTVKTKPKKRKDRPGTEIVEPKEASSVGNKDKKQKPEPKPKRDKTAPLTEEQLKKIDLLIRRANSRAW